jgi:hypothetical protein
MQSGASTFTTTDKELVLANLEKIPTPEKRPLHRSKAGVRLEGLAAEHAQESLLHSR